MEKNNAVVNCYPTTSAQETERSNQRSLPALTVSCEKRSLGPSINDVFGKGEVVKILKFKVVIKHLFSFLKS